MRNINSYWQLFFFIYTLCLTSMAYAQSAAAENRDIEKTNAEVPVAKQTDSTIIETKADPKKDRTATTANKVDAPADKGTKKMVQNATINLQTTVTGNQEQPRVLYILPWQSPAPEDVDFESFSNDQRVVFGHVEREELRRELEAAGEE